MPRFASYVWFIFVGLKLTVSAAPGEDINLKKHMTTLTVTQGCITVITFQGSHPSICDQHTLKLTFDEINYPYYRTGDVYGSITVQQEGAGGTAAGCRKRLSFPIDADEIEFGYGSDDSNQPNTDKLLCIRNPQNHHKLFEVYSPDQPRCCPPDEQSNGDLNSPVSSDLVGSTPAEVDTSYPEIASSNVDTTELNPDVASDGGTTDTPNTYNFDQDFFEETEPET